MKFAHVSTIGTTSVVTLARPDRLNAISEALLDDAHAALVQAQNDPATRAIVLTGEGRAFCAGDDLKEFGAQTRSNAAIAVTCDKIQLITRDIMFGPKLVVGAVHGYAVGGGFEWVLNCDLVVAADDLVCFFPEMSLGHFVTGGVTHLLPQSVGHQRAIELMVLGERQDAVALQALGLVNRVVTREAMMPTALELASRIAERSAFSTSRLKRVLTLQAQSQLTGSLELERVAAMECFGNEDTARRVREFAASRTL